jgi:hypothetical protein
MGKMKAQGVFRESFPDASTLTTVGFDECPMVVLMPSAAASAVIDGFGAV